MKIHFKNAVGRSELYIQVHSDIDDRFIYWLIFGEELTSISVKKADKDVVYMPPGVKGHMHA